MKRCPNCNDIALYRDELMNCPVCNAALVSSTVQNNATNNIGNNALVRTYGRTNEQNRENTDGNAAPAFETRNGLYYHFRGSVIEVNSNSRLSSRLKKWINSILRYEPYQFGHTSHETNIRVEGFHEGELTGPRRDVVVYGDIEGNVHLGDDVEIVAIRHGNRYIVKRLYSYDTQEYIRPRPQIPAALVIVLSVAVLALAVMLISAVVSLFTSGAIYVILSKIFRIVITIAIGYYFLRWLFRRLR